MAALTATKAYKGELAGEHQLLLLTATVESDSDTITLTAADHDAASIVGILGSNITGGIDDKFTNIQVSYSDLTITITSVEQDGYDCIYCLADQNHCVINRKTGGGENPPPTIFYYLTGEVPL
jgi:hypothetical protein